MNSKLTLSIEKEVIEQAKVYAQSKGRSLSNLVEHFLMSLNKKSTKEKAFSPFVKSMKGIIQLPKNYDYKKDKEERLVKKYLNLDK
jgi:hypothetical protein